MNQFTIHKKLRDILSKFLERIDPYLRGIVFMFFAVIIALLYDEFTSPDPKHNLFARQRFVLIIFRFIAHIGGKFMLLGIFVVIGIFIIIYDVRNVHFINCL